MQTNSEPPAVDRVVAALSDIIHGLDPGAVLPSEATMAADHSVSRLTVREAMRVLAGRGLVDLGRGRRAVVREPDGAALGDVLAMAMRHDGKSFFELVEVRQALEIQAATLAARRVNRAGLAAIETALDGMRTALQAASGGPDRAEAEQRFNRCDVGFHEALALCSGNRMLTWLLEAMATPLQRSFELSMRGRELRGFTLAETLAAHQRILDRVRAGDSRGAALAMRTHLKDAERDLRAALNAQPLGLGPPVGA